MVSLFINSCDIEDNNVTKVGGLVLIILILCIRLFINSSLDTFIILNCIESNRDLRDSTV